MLDYCVFRHATRNRVLLNLGGIANMTALPAGCSVNGHAIYWLVEGRAAHRAIELSITEGENPSVG